MKNKQRKEGGTPGLIVVFVVFEKTHTYLGLYAKSGLILHTYNPKINALKSKINATIIAASTELGPYCNVVS